MFIRRLSVKSRLRFYAQTEHFFFFCVPFKPLLLLHPFSAPNTTNAATTHTVFALDSERWILLFHGADSCFWVFLLFDYFMHCFFLLLLFFFLHVLPVTLFLSCSCTNIDTGKFSFLILIFFLGFNSVSS